MSEQDVGMTAPEPVPVQTESADQIQQVTPAADESHTSESVAVQETPEEAAARIVTERQVRERRERNREAAERRVLATERDTYKQLVDKLLQGQRQSPQPPPAAPQSVEPRRDFNPKTGKPYEDYADFVEARSAFISRQEAEETFNRRMREVTEQQQRAQAQTQAERIEEAHVARNRDFARTVPDFEDVTSQHIEIPGPAAEAIKRTANGSAIVYAIGKNPEVANHFARMGPVEQVLYVGQLSHWCASQTPQISNAAPAGRTVGSKPATGGSPPEDPDAYMAWANKKFGRR